MPAPVEGLDAAIGARAWYREAGADLLFVEAPESRGRDRARGRELADVPLLFNYAEGGKTPPVQPPRLAELGFAVVIFPISTLLVATTAIRSVLAQIRRDGTPREALPSMLAFEDFLDFIGLPEIRSLEQQFAAREPAAERGHSSG